MTASTLILGAALATCIGAIPSYTQQDEAATHSPADSTSGAHPASVAPPAKNGEAVPQSSLGTLYAVGPADVLSISVWQEKELSPTVTVRPDGRITLPLIGEIFVANLTPVEIADVLRQRLKSLVVQPRVDVTVAEIHSRMVYITGEVAHPGAYPLTTSHNILQMIAEAGGVTPFASRKNIRILHQDGSATSAPMTYKQLIRPVELQLLPILLPGDTVVVP